MILPRPPFAPKDATESMKRLMDRLKESNPQSPFFRPRPQDVEDLKAGIKEFVYEISDGSQKPITKTKREFEGMTVGEVRKIANCCELCVEARLIDKCCDEGAYDFF